MKIKSIILPLFAVLFAVSPVAFADDRGDGSHLELVSYPLIHATYHGDIAEVKRLLDSGANPNAEDDEGETALHWAAINGRLEIAKILLSAGADINAADNYYGATALIYAARDRHAEIVKLLLSTGTNPNVARDDGTTALMMAVFNKNVEIVKILLTAGANPNATDEDGKTALYHAEWKRHAEVISILQNFRPSVSPEEYIAGLQAEYCGDIATIECQEDYISPEEPAEEIAEEPAEPETKTVCRSFANGINPDNTEWGRIGASEAGVGETEYAAIRAAIRICENDGLTECQTDLEVKCEEVVVQ